MRGSVKAGTRPGTGVKGAVGGAVQVAGIFDDPKYKSTNTVQFRGQEKGQSNPLGQNPNQSVEDEYITNLQQQVHFMELELKILKEKVIEDEKNSGIGSMFDDEKTSHQHINLLKTKYMKMRRDYEKKMQELNKIKLDVISDQYILNSQIEIITQHTAKLYENKQEYELQIKKDLFDTDKKGKEAQKAKLSLEADLRQLEAELKKEDDQNYENVMILNQGKVKDEYSGLRHDRDLKLITANYEEVTKELDTILANKKAADDVHMGKADLQKLITDEKKYREDIEGFHSEHQRLLIKVKVLEDANAFLEEKKEELEKEKRQTEEANEELVKKKQDKEDNYQKRLIAKITREKNQVIRELVQKEDNQGDQNEEFSRKYAEETGKLDDLLDGLTHLHEQMRLALEKEKYTREKVADYRKLIEELRAMIETKQQFVDNLLEKVKEERKINVDEEERNRKLQKANTALKSKLEFIEVKYDYTSSAKGMSITDFKELIASNINVNGTLENFQVDLAQLQKEIQTLEVQKQMI